MASCERCTTQFFTRCFGLIADCIHDISSGVPVYFFAVLIIDFIGAVVTSVASLAHCTTFGATISAFRTIALAPAFAHCLAIDPTAGPHTTSNGFSIKYLFAHSSTVLVAPINH